MHMHLKNKPATCKAAAAATDARNRSVEVRNNDNSMSIIANQKTRASVVGRTCNVSLKKFF